MRPTLSLTTRSCSWDLHMDAIGPVSAKGRHGSMHQEYMGDPRRTLAIDVLDDAFAENALPWNVEQDTGPVRDVVEVGRAQLRHDGYSCLLVCLDAWALMSDPKGYPRFSKRSECVYPLP